MPDYSKVFTYETEGLSYTVSIYEVDGAFFADIEVLEGAMDVNAVYFGDDDFSGGSASLGGPLNMNGTQVQWDEAQELSDPGLGPEGADKETYLEAGDTLELELLNVDSLDDIDVFGIRATSTSTDEGSIKAVSDDPEEPEEPEEPEDPEEPTFDKVLFITETPEGDDPGDGVLIFADAPEDSGEIALPEDVEPTFENYLTFYDEEVDGYDIPSLDSINFYSLHPDGYPVELFSIEAPEDGFQDAEEVLAAYDAAIEAGALDPDSGEDMIATLSLPETVEEDTVEDDVDLEDEVEMA